MHSKRVKDRLEVRISVILVPKHNYKCLLPQIKHLNRTFMANFRHFTIDNTSVCCVYTNCG